MFGTLYYNPAFARSNWLLALSEFLDIKLEGKVSYESPEFNKLFPLERTPAFISSNGFKLTESLAIAYYLVNKSKNPEFSGITEEEKASNWKWYSFITSDMINLVSAILDDSNSDKNLNKLSENFEKNLQYIDDYLSKNKYLVSDSIVICDIFARCFFIMIKGFKLDYSKYENINRFIEDVSIHPIFSKILSKN